MTNAASRGRENFQGKLFVTESLQPRRRKAPVLGGFFAVDAKRVWDTLFLRDSKSFCDRFDQRGKSVAKGVLNL
jgi:hypothetical protein